MLSTPDIEPYEGGSIDVGTIVYELLSAALDPIRAKKGPSSSGWTLKSRPTPPP